MSTIAIVKNKELKFKTVEKGLTSAEVLSQQFKGVLVQLRRLQAGVDYKPELYVKKNQVFFFTKGSGYIAMPKIAYNITEQAVFVPLFDKEKFFIRAGADLEFMEILVDLTKEDIEKLADMRMTLPHFKLHSQCERYEERFKGPDVISRSILEPTRPARSSMGSVFSVGPNFVGEHAHEDLEQYFLGLEGTSFKFSADGEAVSVEEGDLVHIPKKAKHAVKCDKGKIINYVWFEIVNKK